MKKLSLIILTISLYSCGNGQGRSSEIEEARIANSAILSKPFSDGTSIQVDTATLDIDDHQYWILSPRILEGCSIIHKETCNNKNHIK